MNELRPQVPTPPNEWLHDGAPDWTRYFTTIVYLGKDAEPWAECTDAERISWQEEHPEPEPITEEVQQ